MWTLPHILLLSLPLMCNVGAVERARRLEMAQNLFVVMRVCSTVVLSHLDAGFEPQCPH